MADMTDDGSPDATYKRGPRVVSYTLCSPSGHLSLTIKVTNVSSKTCRYLNIYIVSASLTFSQVRSRSSVVIVIHFFVVNLLPKLYTSFCQWIEECLVQ